LGLGGLGLGGHGLGLGLGHANGPAEGGVLGKTKSKGKSSKSGKGGH
jgi:hypothetical protein